MATTAHCIYCFEALSASLKKRELLSLAQVETLWSRFTSEAERSQSAEAPDDDGPVENETEAEEEEDYDVNEASGNGASSGFFSPQPQYRLPSISRLQNPSSSSGSNSSTPSSLSATSSRTALTDTSKSSSNSSFSSFPPTSSTPPIKPEQEHPLFVTWNTVSTRGHKSLRGCIGTFDAQELSEGLKSYALTAAFEDTRFSPITSSELPSLSVSVTLLTAFTPTLNPFDWTLGTHGLRISFSHHGRRFGATYLPDVAIDQGWTKEETLISLMHKAGWNGRSADWRHVDDLGVVRYQGRKQSVAYEDWKEWRRWVMEKGAAP